MVVESPSQDSHAELQGAVIEEFAPRFAPGAKVIYLVDTAKMNPCVDHQRLLDVGFSPTQQDRLPDIVLHDRCRNRLFLMEAATSHGPLDRKRLVEFKTLIESRRSQPIYMSAFLDFEEFGKHVASIAWGTVVWLAEEPDHLIHFGGNRLLGPIP